MRVYNYHKHTIIAFSELVGAAGLKTLKEIQGHHVHRRVSGTQVKTYSELFPQVKTAAFLKGEIPLSYQNDFNRASAAAFQNPVQVPHAA